jgi:nitrogen regulatory protein PII
VKNALSHIGLDGLTISAVSGCGRETGTVLAFRGTSYKPNGDFLSRVKMEICVPDCLVQQIIGVISDAAMSGERSETERSLSPPSRKRFVSETEIEEKTRSDTLGGYLRRSSAAIYSGPHASYRRCKPRKRTVGPLGQPPVLGELLMRVVLGNLSLFEAGVEPDLVQLLAVGWSSLQFWSAFQLESRIAQPTEKQIVPWQCAVEETV